MPARRASTSDEAKAVLAEHRTVLMPRRTLLIGFGALGATLLARCGGRGGGTPPPTGTPSNVQPTDADICLGAAVGAVGAGVGGILAAAVLDTPTFLDFMLVFAALITAGLPGPSGLVATVLADVVSSGEILVALHDHC